jgi:alanine racemase
VSLKRAPSDARDEGPDETAILTIDRDAIAANYRTLRALAAPAECAAVVKADAYGLGMVQIAATLWNEGCRTFFVATLDEGERLRAVLPEAAIYVLAGLMPGTDALYRAQNLRPVLNSADEVREWAAFCKAQSAKLPCAVHIDTGMNRLGLAADEVEGIASADALWSALALSLVMSHLACADEPGHPANERQWLAFERLRKMLPEAPASLANSSGIFLGPAFHFDLVRPGAALYGINPTPAEPNPMAPVVRLQAKVIQTRSLNEGAGVGYGHTFRTSGPLDVATISLGYADGWHRRAASAAWFDNVRLPFVGRVSMDSIILDISALPPGRLGEGDLVELLGPSQSVDDAAGQAGTIGYEILTSLGLRFHRRYVDG